jgi:hypothetical protein
VVAGKKRGFEVLVKIKKTHTHTPIEEEEKKTTRMKSTYYFTNTWTDSTAIRRPSQCHCTVVFVVKKQCAGTGVAVDAAIFGEHGISRVNRTQYIFYNRHNVLGYCRF